MSESLFEYTRRLRSMTREQWEDEFGPLLDRLQGLDYERDRYRAALEKIEHEACKPYARNTAKCLFGGRACDIARRALEGEP